MIGRALGQVDRIAMALLVGAVFPPKAVIGRALGQVDRIAMAVLVGAVFAGSVGFSLLNQQLVSSAPPAVIFSHGPQGGEDLGSLLRTRSAPPSTATSPVATSSIDNPSFGTARVAPYLESVEPKTLEVPVNASIVMSFSQPMNRPSVEISFDIAPTAEGRLAWRDDSTLGFEPFRLAYATAYQVEVRGRSLRGASLSGLRSWTFVTVSAPPDVLAPGARAINVPILLYHYIRVNPVRADRMGFALSVTPSDFEAQMDWLAQNGYHPITTEDLYSYLAGARGLPSKPVILTFDDGYADFYTTALPILRSHGFKAVAYVVSGFVGRPGYMTAVQIHEADRSGVEIGSHTANHANLANLPADAVRYQLVESKQFLEQLLGHPVVSFCYPSGKFTAAVAWQVSAVGFHNATTTRFGYSHTLADRYLWTRLRVSGGEPLDQFALAVRSAS